MDGRRLALAIVRVSRHERHVNRHDRIAVITHGVTVDQHDRHRGMAATFQRLNKTLMRLEVHADPAAKMLIERDHIQIPSNLPHRQAASPRTQSCSHAKER